jgi:preprotein translocase subunit SecE
MKKFFNAVGGFFSGMSQYLKSVYVEMKKVVWPTRSQLVNNTVVVLVSIVVIGAVIWMLDLLFSHGMAMILSM